MTSIQNYGFWNHKEECFCLEKDFHKKHYKLERKKY